jgi:probable phosphoglycerate mutase
MAAGRLDMVFSSPQLRACETAGTIAAMADCPLRVSRDLDEIDFGCWTGQSFETLEGDPAWQRWNVFRDSAATPAGETMADAAARLTRLMDRLHGSLPGASVCLVSHADVIKAALCHHRGESFQSVHAFEIAPASVSTVAVDNHGRDIIAVNQRSWRNKVGIAR